MEPNVPGTPAPLLRLAEAEDTHLVFDWRNDPWIVSLSTSRRTVTWAEHETWFASMLDRSSHLLFIIHTHGGAPAGSVRLDRKGAETAVLTVYLMKDCTGRGLGPRSIGTACERAFEHWPELARIVAYVRTDNQPSLKAFARASFLLTSEEEACPQDHVVLARERNSR